jgi:hypothetical protein
MEQHGTAPLSSIRGLVSSVHSMKVDDDDDMRYDWCTTDVCVRAWSLLGLFEQT